MTTTTELYEKYLQHSRITFDTRKLQPGDIFFALRGDLNDGNDYAAQALAAGAAYAVIDRPELADRDPRFLLVANSLKALQDLARHHRRQFHIPVIGITGSNGKTTTKELVTAVMAIHYRNTHATAGNYNNHIGVPLTLLAMPASTEAAIIEMGANHQGEIDTLSRICEPTHGIITNIGNAHLEGFGGIEGVKKGKSELYRFLAERDGVAIINGDENFLLDLAAPVARKIVYQRSNNPHPTHKPAEIKLIATHPFIRYAFLDEDGTLLEGDAHLSGEHNFNNVMTAVAVGKYFKVPGKKICEAIANYIPGNNRSQKLEKNGIIFHLDAYNANPNSMQASLHNFAQAEAPFKAAFLGDMLELGEVAPAEHLRIAQLALSLNFNHIALVGPHFAQAAHNLSLPHFAGVDDLRSWFSRQNWSGGYHILLKGSRGMKMERLIE